MILLNAIQGTVFGIGLAFILVMIYGLGRFIFRRAVAIIFNMPRFESGNGAPKSWWEF